MAYAQYNFLISQNKNLERLKKASLFDTIYWLMDEYNQDFCLFPQVFVFLSFSSFFTDARYHYGKATTSLKKTI